MIYDTRSALFRSFMATRTGRTVAASPGTAAAATANPARPIGPTGSA